MVLRSLFVLAAFAATAASAQDEIPWGRAIEWSDFKGERPLGDGHEAYTAYRIKVDVTQAGGHAPENIRVVCMFDRSASWATNSARANAALLDHERLHFDIGEVHARMLTARLMELGADVDLHQAVQSALDAVTKASHDMQELYDRETGHGLDVAAQARWAGRVRDLLKAWPIAPR